MRRRGFPAAVAAALILVASAVGPASASPIRLGTVDQDVEPQAAWVDIDYAHPMTQSFTAGATGRLVNVALYCSADAKDTSVQIDLGSTVAIDNCSTTAGWAVLANIIPPAVQTGSQYTMTIWVLGGPSSLVHFAVSASDYAGGCLGSNGACVGDPTDIAFRTYVQPLPTVAMTWSPAHLAPGASEQVTLTIVATFPGFVVPDGAQGGKLAQIWLDTQPSWFVPSAITCSAVVDPGWCTLIGPATWPINTDGSPLTVTITITGTATVPNPPGPSAASGRGCIGYPYNQWPYMDCVTGQADLVISGTAKTPPPTGTAAGEGSRDDPAAPWLPGALLLGATSLLFVVRARTRAARI